MSDIPNANFPQKLFSLMENEQSDIVCWSERGLAFRVVDQEKFAEEIVPKYFRHTKMTSFQRQLNLYGFRRVTKGEDVGSYYHPKFQRGRRDLVPEIKRLPGKTSAYGHDDKSKTSLLPHFSPENRFNPTDGNIVEVMGANNRPITMSKLTMKIAGINSSDVSTLPPQITSPNVPAPVFTPAYVAENSIQFIQVIPNTNPLNPKTLNHPTLNTLNNNNNNNNNHPNNNNNTHNTHINNNNNNNSSITTTFPTQLTTVCLSREIEQNPPPLLLRNFSVSSSFDEEYRLPLPNEEEISPSGETPSSSSSSTSTCDPVSSPTSSSSTTAVTNETLSQNVSNIPLDRSSSLVDFMSKPQVLLRDESESWVKLGALDQLHDMDPFDIDTVFE